MSKHFIRLSLILLSVVLSSSVFAVTKTWFSTTSGGLWTTASNWSPSGVPAANDDIIINCSSAAGFAITAVPVTPIPSYNSVTIGGTGAGFVTLTGASSTNTLWTVNLYANNNLILNNLNVNLTTGLLSTVAVGKTLRIATVNILTVQTGARLTINGTFELLGGNLLNSSGLSTALVVANNGILDFSVGNNGPTMPVMNVNAGGTLVLDNNTSSSGTATLRFPSTAIPVSGTVSVRGFALLNTLGTAPSYQPGSTLEYNLGEAYTVTTQEWPTTNSPPNVKINQTSGAVSLTASRSISGTLNLTAGVFTLSGSSTTLTFNGPIATAPIVRASGTITCTTSPSLSFDTASGTGGTWTIPSGTFTAAPTITNLTIDVLAGNALALNEQTMTVSSSYTQTTGNVILGAGDLQVVRTSFTISSPGTTKMIITSATSGYLKTSWPSSTTASFTYPLGTNVGTPYYEPIIFNMDSNNTTRVIGYKQVDAAHPNVNSPTAQNYTTRYYQSTIVPSTGTYTYDARYDWVFGAPDEVGSSSKYGLSAWNGSAWEGYSSTINTSSGFAYFQIFNGTHLNAPLGFDVTGRQLNNDDACGAIALSPGAAGAGCSSPVAGSTAGATQTYSGCSGFADDDVWYKFVAAATAHSVQVTPSATFNPELQAYTLSSGTCPTATFTAVSGTCTNLTSTGAVETMALTGLTIGVTYYVRVYHNSSTQIDDPSFSICVLTPPANDEPCGSVVLTPGTPGVNTCTGTSGNAALASESLNSSSCVFTGTQADVWFKYVATSTSHTIQVSGSGTFAPVVQAYTISGTCPSLGTPSAFNSPSCTSTSTGGATIRHQMTGMTIGNTYYLRVYHSSSTVPSNTGFTICVLTPFQNDEICNGASNTAVTLTPATTCTGTSGDVALASQTLNSGSCVFTGTQADVWYKFVATASSHVVRVTGNGTFDAVVQAYTVSGSCPGIGAPSAFGSPSCENDNAAGGTENLQMTGLTIGNTYYARVYHASSTVPTNTTFTICVLSPPANDEPCGAVILTPGFSCAPTAGTVELASQTLNSSACVFTGTQADVWYKFVATSSTHYATVTGNGTFAPVVQAYTISGTCPSLGAPSAFGSPSCTSTSTGGATISHTLTGLTIGNTYYVRVYHSSSSVPSNTTFSICITNPAANDNPCGAIALVPQIQTCSNTSGSVNNSTQTYSGCSGTADDDVWFRFVATASSHIIRVDGDASFDAVVQAYTLTSGSCPSATFTAVSGTCTDVTFSGGIETLTMNSLTIGVTYYIRVYHYSSGFPATPGFTICVIAPPANDECSGAVALGTISSTCTGTAGDINAATQSSPATSCSFASNIQDVWYSFVASGTSANVVVSGASGLDVVVQAYSGACGSLTSLDCEQNWSSGTEVLGLTGLTNGQTYFVRVYHDSFFSSNPTNTTFTICVVIPPSNDDCSGAIALTSGSTLSGQTTLLASQSINGYYSSYYDDDDLWYSFVPSGSTARFTLTCGAGFDGVLELRSTTCNGFRNVGRDFASAAGSEVISVTNLTPGATYRLRVFSYGSVRGSFSILAQNGTYVPGTYDNVANAFVSSTGVNAPGVAFSTYGMEIGEPRGINWGFDYDLETGVELSNTAWFVFTPATSGQYSFTGSIGGNQFAMAVYSASNAAAMLAGGSTEIASDLSSASVALNGACLTAGANYYVQFTGYAGATGTPSLTITNTTPLVAPVAQAPTSVSCTGFTANWLAAANATSYVIDVATDAGFTSLVLTNVDAGTGTSYVASGLSASGIFYYRIRGVACSIATGDSNTIVVESQPASVSATSNATTVCDGQLFDLNATGGSGAVSWLWSGPNGYSESVQNPDPFAVTGLSAGNYFVTATNACGDAVSNTITLTVDPLPGNSGVISGLTTVSIGTVGVSYSVPAIANATGYSWAYSGGDVTIIGSGSNVTLDFGLSATSGDLTVFGTNACGSSPDIATLSIVVVSIQTYYKDFDGDGFSDGQSTESVSQPVGFYLAGQLIALSGDCDDDDADINPNSIWYLDADEDGYAFTSVQVCESPGAGYTLIAAPVTDCDDSNSLVNPTTVWYLDVDGDGYSVGTLAQCDQLPGYVLIGSLFGFTDCDDSNSDINPGADEWCNGVDDNCSGASDEGLDADTYYEDADSDGSGNPEVFVTSCAPVVGYVLNSADCDDDNANVSGTSVWYLDADGDGYAALSVVACNSPGVGYTVTLMETNDCDDNAFGVNPGVEEVCGNGIDDNCNGYFNEECDPAPMNDARTSSVAILSYTLGACVNTTGTVLGATVSAQSNSSVVTGEDVWYRFTAASPGVSISVSSLTLDAVIELQDAAGNTLEFENAIGTAGTEILNYYNSNTPLTIGAVYYIAVRNYNSAFGTGSFDLCVQRIRATSCNSGPGPYNPTATFKATYVGASVYTFTFTNTSTLQNYIVSVSGGSTLVSLASIPQGATYNVSISCTYNLQNGAGVSEFITIPAPNVCQMSMASPPATPNLFLRTQDQCPIAKAPNAIIGANVWLSGALNYEWRFQQVAPVAGAWSAPVAGPSTNRYLNLFPLGLTPGATYNVEIRAVYSGGVITNYGSTQCLQITAPGGMVMEENEEANDFRMMTESPTSSWDVCVYPNPSSGEQLNLQWTGDVTDGVSIRVFDALGALVDMKQLVTSARSTSASPIYELASGIYFVEVIANNERKTVRWIVSR